MHYVAFSEIEQMANLVGDIVSLPVRVVGDRVWVELRDRPHKLVSPKCATRGIDSVTTTPRVIDDDLSKFVPSSPVVL